MKVRQKIISLFVSILLLTGLLVHWQLVGASLVCNSQGITITGADANWCNSTTSPPGTLSNLLNMVMPRVAADYARSIASFTLNAVPNGLDTVLEQVTNRIGFDYARANRHTTLDFPIALVNDTAAPQLVGTVSQTAIGTTDIRIQWLTNEFATSHVSYGTTSGNYPNTVTDELFVKNHTAVITDLQTDVIYYFRVSSTDPSGNTFQSSEMSFTITPEIYVYLPIVTR